MDIKQQIIDHHKSDYKIDEKGYLNTNEENLLEKFPNWNEIQKELSDGDGSELKSDSNNRAKFRAVHSSSALCVNNFALVKLHKSSVSLFGESGFSEAAFERKFPTFLSKSANLDFYLENDNSRIGIESKFIEIVKRKLPNEEKNLEPYIDHKKLPEILKKSFNEIINFYKTYKEPIHLDVAQLIKHSIALSLYACDNKDKKTKLIYLYWLPINYKDIDIYKEHDKELDVFKEQIKGCQLPFEAYSYFDLWKMMEKNEGLSGILEKIKARYEFTINT
jgi:hypothetical protein